MRNIVYLMSHLMRPRKGELGSFKALRDLLMKMNLTKVWLLVNFKTGRSGNIVADSLGFGYILADTSHYGPCQVFKQEHFEEYLKENSSVSNTGVL